MYKDLDMTDYNMNIKIENHGVIPKEEEQATPEELYARLSEKIKYYQQMICR